MKTDITSQPHSPWASQAVELGSPLSFLPPVNLSIVGPPVRHSGGGDTCRQSGKTIRSGALSRPITRARSGCCGSAGSSALEAAKLEAVAHTLPYDAAVMTASRIPRARFALIGVPVLVMNGTKTDPRLREAAQAIVDGIPAARHSELPWQTHNVKPDVPAPAVVEFFTAPTATTSSRT
jgi:hypothetical protein